MAQIAGDDREAMHKGGRADAAVTGPDPLNGGRPGLVQRFHLGGVRQNLIVYELSPGLQKEVVSERQLESVGFLLWVKAVQERHAPTKLFFHHNCGQLDVIRRHTLDAADNFRVAMQHKCQRVVVKYEHFAYPLQQDTARLSEKRVQLRRVAGHLGR